MPELACLNGQTLSPESATVPIWDRGFLFGDAVYEVMRIYAGRPWLETEHLARLSRSLDAIEIFAYDMRTLRERMHGTLRQSGILEGTAYLHITRGVAPRTHAYPAEGTARTELIVVRSYDDSKAKEGRTTGVGVITAADLRWGRCDIKSTNLLANVMAVEAARRKGAVEALLYDERGKITEATHSSLFWVRAGRLEATPEGPAILPGTTRAHLLELAERAQVPFSPVEISTDELIAADEVLISGTTIEVTPVVTVDSRTIGSGAPGPITRRLQAAFDRSIAAFRAVNPQG